MNRHVTVSHEPRGDLQRRRAALLHRTWTAAGTQTVGPVYIGNLFHLLDGRYAPECPRISPMQALFRRLTGYSRPAAASLMGATRVTQKWLPAVTRLRETWWCTSQMASVTCDMGRNSSRQEGP